MASDLDGIERERSLTVGFSPMSSIITADTASELRLKIGDNVVAMLKSFQVMILRNQM